MKRCVNCKKRFGDSVKFCPVCGTLLEEEKSYGKVLIAGAILLVLIVLIIFFVWNRSNVIEEYDTADKKSQTQAVTHETLPTAETVPNTVQTTYPASFYEESSELPSNTGYRSDEFILAGSDSRYISASEVSGLTQYELRIARNEIFARRGRIFEDPSLAAYFNQKSWYHGTIPAKYFSEDSLSKVEKANIEVIKAEEARR